MTLNFSKREDFSWNFGCFIIDYTISSLVLSVCATCESRCRQLGLDYMRFASLLPLLEELVRLSNVIKRYQLSCPYNLLRPLHCKIKLRELNKFPVSRFKGNLLINKLTNLRVFWYNQEIHRLLWKPVVNYSIDRNSMIEKNVSQHWG
jgi:hypothetical protein